MTNTQAKQAITAYIMFFNEPDLLRKLLESNRLQVHECCNTLLKMLFSDNDSCIDEVLFRASFGSDDLQMNVKLFEQVREDNWKIGRDGLLH